MRALGLKSLVDPRRDQYPKLILKDGPIPSKVEYAPLYPPVDDQGNFGTCVAFGTGKVFEYFYNKQNNKQLLISKRALFSEIKQNFYPHDTQDDGAQVSDGLQILSLNYILESDFPYEPAGDFSQFLHGVPANLGKTDFKIKHFVSVNPVIDDMKNALFHQGPLAIGTSFAKGWMEIGSDGRLPGSNLTSAGGHCMSITGYDDDFVNLDGSKGAFHYINNWSTAWGQEGYAWLPYNVDTDFFPTDLFTVQVQ